VLCPGPAGYSSFVQDRAGHSHHRAVQYHIHFQTPSKRTRMKHLFAPYYRCRKYLLQRWVKFTKFTCCILLMIHCTLLYIALQMLLRFMTYILKDFSFVKSCMICDSNHKLLQQVFSSNHPVLTRLAAVGQLVDEVVKSRPLNSDQLLATQYPNCSNFSPNGPSAAVVRVIRRLLCATIIGLLL